MAAICRTPSCCSAASSTLWARVRSRTLWVVRYNSARASSCSAVTAGSSSDFMAPFLPLVYLASSIRYPIVRGTPALHASPGPRIYTLQGHSQAETRAAHTHATRAHGTTDVRLSLARAADMGETRGTLADRYQRVLSRPDRRATGL